MIAALSERYVRRAPPATFRLIVNPMVTWIWIGGLIVLAGGSRLEDTELLWRMQVAVEAGAIGCSVGRNIFMHANPEAITRALSRVIRERWTAEKALDALRQETA